MHTTCAALCRDIVGEKERGGAIDKRMTRIELLQLCTEVSRNDFVVFNLTLCDDGFDQRSGHDEGTMFSRLDGRVFDLWVDRYG